ncbi:hypothetical protein OQH60_06110 [Campylobacter sp. MIT 21-1685]|uniref:hypothetical protein n=1 Tax=unclassified Campylobacter TaxID=2593542 RepID=UPI00224B7CC5|nr:MULTISPECIES: hypothetical protein [unclassified Campylobacter]MCX2683460.1 hypothetical protein [Campylobacter sp. MIT 21-1684]MCX2751718.1 hypothetical protein [Campylobacter sp. MIT 21-1682]MCX2807920.1 hypothetical protein [Campylobacter sp. MIT 21-1685]
MKRFCIFFLVLFFGSSCLFADGIKVHGVIAEVYENNRTLVLDSAYGGVMAIRVVPHTEIDMDNCGFFGMDKHGRWKDLKIGEFVEVELYYTSYQPNAMSVPVAKEIQIECHRRAY